MQFTLFKSFLNSLIAIFAATAFAGQTTAVTVAVAANFTAPAKQLAAQFEQASGHPIKLAFGATGAFAAQIQNAAPFDILLAADSATPQQLAATGFGLADSRFTYAIGRLVLWSPQAGLVDGQGAILQHGDFKHLAIANAKLAPYGAAAQEVLTSLGLLKELTPRLVEGANIGQTFQFVDSGNAELGFVALAQVMMDGHLRAGSYWLPPQKLYAPLRQDALLLKPGRDNPVAREFLAFLRSKSALDVIRSFGYDLP